MYDLLHDAYSMRSLLDASLEMEVMIKKQVVVGTVL